MRTLTECCLSRFVDVRFCFLTMLVWVPFEVIGTHALVLFGETLEMKQVLEILLFLLLVYAVFASFSFLIGSCS